MEKWGTAENGMKSPRQMTRAVLVKPGEKVWGEKNSERQEPGDWGR